MNKNIWYKVSGVITPGGDPFFKCPVCHGDGHCYGVEHEKNYHHKCNNCGMELIYPIMLQENPEVFSFVVVHPWENKDD